MAPIYRVAAMHEHEETIRRLAGFESLFAKENLLLGLSIWLRTTAILLLVSLAADVLGLLALLRELILPASLAAYFILLQLAAGHEAARRYRLPVSPWCWWSIYWRLLVFLLPLLLLLAIMMVPADAGIDTEELNIDTTAFLVAQLIILVLSIIPLGLATSQAFRISLNRYVSPRGGGTPGADE